MQNRRWGRVGGIHMCLRYVTAALLLFAVSLDFGARTRGENKGFTQAPSIDSCVSTTTVSV